MCWHVHMVNTSGADARARRAHAYASRCAQCGADVDAATHVASHVLTYPLCNMLIARPSLKTCCRSCNGKHQSSEEGARCVGDAGFCTCSAGDRVGAWLCWPAWIVWGGGGDDNACGA